MRILVLALSAMAFGQQTTSYTFDSSGKRSEGPRISASQKAGSTERRETLQNLNGRQVPLETTEERVISDSGGVRVVERVYKRYDANGQLALTDKTRIEERKNSDGSVNSVASVMRSNVSGGFDLLEKRATTSSKSGDTTTSSTTVEHASINGNFAPSERIEEVRRDAADGTGSLNATSFQRDTNGRFYEARRENTVRTMQNGSVVENTALYGALEHAGMKLLQQRVVRSSKNPSGAESKQVEIYEVAEPGRAITSAAPKLKEMQSVERTPHSGGVTETVTVRRPNPSDPSKLGPPQTVAQTVCTGECK